MGEGELLAKPDISQERWQEILEKKEHPSPDELIAIARLFNVTLDVLLKQDLKARTKAKNIRFLVVDIDGVLTDGGMYYTESGDEFKKFNTKDGMAIKNLTAKGFPVGIISSGINRNLIQRRAELLKIENVYVGSGSKLEILKTWCADLNIKLNEVAYIGDDINDIEVIQNVGFSACPADAVQQVQQIVHTHLKRRGGDGCVREFVDTFLRRE